MEIQWFHYLDLQKFSGKPLLELVKEGKISKERLRTLIKEQEMVVLKLLNI